MGEAMLRYTSPLPRSLCHRRVPWALVLFLCSMSLGSAQAYVLRGRILSHADFGRYRAFYIAPRGVSSRLMRLMARSFETLSYKRVRDPEDAQFLLRIREEQKFLRVRVPIPPYGYEYGMPWGPGFYGPGWGWYDEGGIGYRMVIRRVLIIRITAVSARRNVPVWRGLAITRIHRRTSLWAIIWHLVNYFPIL